MRSSGFSSRPSSSALALLMFGIGGAATSIRWPLYCSRLLLDMGKRLSHQTFGPARYLADSSQVAIASIPKYQFEAIRTSRGRKLRAMVFGRTRVLGNEMQHRPASILRTKSSVSLCLAVLPQFFVRDQVPWGEPYRLAILRVPRLRYENRLWEAWLSPA